MTDQEWKLLKHNKGIRISLPHTWRTQLRQIASDAGTTPNRLIIEAIQEKFNFFVTGYCEKEVNQHES